MASTELGTTDQATTVTHGRNLVPAGARLYAVWSDTTDLVYQYSDDDGATWSSKTTVSTAETLRATAFYDSVNGRLNIVYAGGDSTSAALSMRAITSNVATGTPGALTTETVIDAGGSNLGVVSPYAFHSPTASNPRYWIIAMKQTAATTWETRAWYVAAGSSADTAGNWSTTNFTNLGSNSDANFAKSGVGVYWTVSGADKVTLVWEEGDDTAAFETVTFDPTAATPTPGTVGSATGTAYVTGPHSVFTNGPMFAINSKADYLVFGRFDRNSNQWDFVKTVNGTSWSSPSGWSDLAMGRCQIALAGGDFYLVHTDSYGAIATTSQTLRYRKITTASDTMGSTTTFSDTAGNGVTVPRDTGTSNLYALYRGSTASPYTVRSDFVNIGGGGDVTAPGAASVTVSSVTSTTVSLSVVMPPDPDVEEYEVRYLTGTTAPATNRSNGTVSTSPTATTPSATVTPSITGLTAGTRITGRVFVKDTSDNWNTGATFTAVPVTSPSFTGRFRSDGITAVSSATDPFCDILVWQLATTDFESGGANAHMRARVGTDAATPPTASTYDLLSTGGSAWQYKNAAGNWTAWPASGLTSSDWARQIRLVNDTSLTSQFVSIRVEQ